MEKKDIKVTEYMGYSMKKMRLNSSISQEDLAYTLNLTRASLINIEKGRQSLSHTCLLKCCRLFNVGPEEFYPKDLSFIEIIQLPKEVKINRQIVELENKLKMLKDKINQP